MRKGFLLSGLAVVVLLTGCQKKQSSFDSDVAFLKKHVDVIVLEDRASSAKVAVVPQYQGRVMTSTVETPAVGWINRVVHGSVRSSTVGRPESPSFGWVNREAVARGILPEQDRKGTLDEHIHLFGGEDRIWLGPEGGQFSTYFAPGAPLDFDHWHVPALFDTEAYDVVEKTKKSCTFKKTAVLHNQSGARFDLEIQRTVQLLSAQDIAQTLNIQIPVDVRFVGFETVNTLTNIGQAPWQKETGLLSVWILGMMNRTAGSTVVIPIKPGPEEQLGPKVKDDYFGKVPADRLIVKDDVLFFRADSEYRSKIGVSPLRATPYCGSYDAENNVLTIVWYNQPAGVTDYVNSAWEIQKEPYKGDVINAYNDGPPAPGQPPLGPFYELETSSPAAALAPQQSMTHIHATMHFTGPAKQLDKMAVSVLGASLEDIKTAFK